LPRVMRPMLVLDWKRKMGWKSVVFVVDVRLLRAKTHFTKAEEPMASQMNYMAP